MSRIKDMFIEMQSDKGLTTVIGRKIALENEIRNRHVAASKLVTQANKLRGALIRIEKASGVELSRIAHKALWRTTARNNHKMFAAKRELIRINAMYRIAERYAFCHESGSFKSKLSVTVK